MTTYFISDLHLHDTRPAITRAFFNWLDAISGHCAALYILGDLFEVWIGDDDDNPEHRRIVERLRQLRQADIPLYVMHGNRDFLLGPAFAAASGAELLDDPTVIDLYGEPVLLMHGDSLCTRDHDYMAFRRQARSPDWQAQLLAKPLAERRAIAAALREQSRSMNSLKAEDIMDVTPAEVVKVMEAHGVQTLIHGHTHRPQRHHLSANGAAAERIVLGDWGPQGWCLAVSPTRRELSSWPLAGE
ncbi:UDP-2,3-diacylglucosamine diphosphatase [Exilibacterium tricleocarpae]|uniref:UDP-2,3-diacylglucosamine hydrolase n=1 Tax=Exilibacterium tricleocarpae TaxID=2591008 RepID=A0A545TLJ9_9GAMM|nr:UDP-2,3-diacylglucosamine diphosphatase [Exilibacterium tricleocarpae]TQV78103.1 UDP-2,3-diacylglucosamine diphosphatase [Exilibacterium tricleocarpae]